jgi:outer membrane protein TolC
MSNPHKIMSVLMSLAIFCTAASLSLLAHPFPDSTLRADQEPNHGAGQSLPDSSGLSRGDGVGARKDSADREMIQLEIARADLEVSSSDIWHRLIPRVSLSAGIGVADLLFIDPSAPSSIMIPKDNYRLNVSLSLSDVLDFPKHARAQLELEIAKARLHKLDTDQAAAREAGRKRQASAQGELALFHEELALIERLVRYNELLFEDGKIAFDVLARSRLQLIGVRKSMLQLQATLSGR